jgi:hypothetical protein
MVGTGPIRLLFFASLVLLIACGGPTVSSSVQSVSPITWTAIQDGEIWFRNSQIQLRFDGDMYCRVFLQKDGKLHSINDIPPDETKAKPPHFLELGDEEVREFKVDYRNIGVSDMKNQLGLGRRLHLTGYAQTSQKIVIEKKLNVELYDDYPDIAIVSATYRNTDKASAIQITRAPISFFRMDAARSNSALPSHAFRVFFGDAEGSGRQQEVDVRYSRSVHFNLENTKVSQAVPLIDLWTNRMGMAIGDFSSSSADLIATVKAAPDQKLEIYFETPTLPRPGPNESFANSRNIWMVHTGDFQTVLERYKNLAQRALGKTAAERIPTRASAKTIRARDDGHLEASEKNFVDSLSIFCGSAAMNSISFRAL